VLLLLPPSEGKADAPARGRPLDLDDLSFPELTSTREKVLAALIELCTDDPDSAAAALGLSPGQRHELVRNTALLTAAARPAGTVYTGVLYDALGLATLDAAAKRRAARSVVVGSALFGALRPGDRIPPYRLSMATKLPAVGNLAAAWRAALAEVLPAAAGRGVVVDLRSSTYAAAWRPAGPLATRTVAVRVLAERDGVRTVVSHMAKHTRGLVARHLLSEGAAPRTPEDVRDALAGGFRVELAPAAASAPRTLDVVVSS
jgi:cytoplasmic iron level regulating protein YaaA (DUF328/UPF0246 family)